MSGDLVGRFVLLGPQRDEFFLHMARLDHRLGGPAGITEAEHMRSGRFGDDVLAADRLVDGEPPLGQRASDHLKGVASARPGKGGHDPDLAPFQRGLGQQRKGCLRRFQRMGDAAGKSATVIGVDRIEGEAERVTVVEHRYGIKFACRLTNCPFLAARSRLC